MSNNTNINIPLDQLDQIATQVISMIDRSAVIALNGDLGSGKTTLCKKIINKLLANDEAIQSPTFPLCIVYDNHTPPIWHVDLYRLGQNKQQQDEISIILQLEKIGLIDALHDNIVLIEWPNIISQYLLPNTIEVNIDFTKNENERSFEIKRI